ncbi:hypothetical protein ACFQ3S_13710 [Mucilaginibacter terrae]|uniref:hypothetical protein n=1 Tax=Mucilaginibacter terrae TaxID=1955052 RepID=UPI00362DF31B
MSPEFFYLYFIAGTIALVLTIYQIVATYQAINSGNIILYFIPVILLYYMAYKVYHVKNDNELM